MPHRFCGHQPKGPDRVRLTCNHFRLSGLNIDSSTVCFAWGWNAGCEVTAPGSLPAAYRYDGGLLFLRTSN
jgi:hypothetical protein